MKTSKDAQIVWAGIGVGLGAGIGVVGDAVICRFASWHRCTYVAPVTEPERHKAKHNKRIDHGQKEAPEQPSTKNLLSPRLAWTMAVIWASRDPPVNAGRCGSACCGQIRPHIN